MPENSLSSLSISTQLKQLISGDDHQEGDQQKDAAHDACKRPGNCAQRSVIFGMADAKSLKQRPESMADVEEQQTDAGSVNQGEERVVQYIGYKVRNCFYFSFFYKVEVCQMDEDENENSNSGVRHGFGADGAAASRGLNGIFSAASLAVLQEQDNSGNNMQKENGVQANSKIGTKMPKE
ncbi:hypothetical protein [uncultured Vibrio sp.]|uniref:hypothetical protein n=1 Tax=uncultured Vibrio sp. TaxID=114054 RepID=UPI002AA887A3|nr:hypothetical protein [uncultured Vibrio sp.]